MAQKHLGLCALSVAFALLGCATAAQRQAVAIRSNTQSAGQQLQACSSAVYNSVAFDPLRAKLPFAADQATLAQMTDASFASDQEIAILLSVHGQLQACRAAFLDQISQTTPSVVPIFAASATESEGSLIDLIQKKQSWGDHVRRVKKVVADSAVQLAAEGRNIDRDLERSNEAELARRQRAFDALARYAQTQQIINSLNRPVVTTANCTQFGNSVSCLGVTQ